MHTNLLAVLLTLLVAAPAGADEIEARTQTSRQAVKDFSALLKEALQSAMKSGGPVEAIGVCRAKAPQIASDMSEDTGWRIARTSLKTRNSNNAPDAWERSVLEQFEARRAAGEDPKTMEHAAIVEAEGRREFRYMKAIPTQEICLSCHGVQIAPPIVEKIDALYPEDKARDFEPGDIRGAFTVAQPM